MTLTKLSLSDLFTGILVICALVITILVVRQQLLKKSPQPELQVRTISNWQEIEFKGPRSGPKDSPVEIIEFYDYQCF